MSVCTCAWCDQSFEGKRSDSLFCNPACKQKYWRWKHHLQLLRKQIMVNLDEIEIDLTWGPRENEASLILGEVSDRLAAMGFVPTEHQMSLPVESYTLSNQLRE